MLTELYIEALLVDKELADAVWDLWYAAEITDDLAAWAWWLSSFDALFLVSGGRELQFGNKEK